jgi:hypothetical protein
MQNILTKNSSGLLAIVTAAGLGYFALTPPTAPPARSAAPEIAFHSAECLVCRLPRHGRTGEPSILGPYPDASEDSAEATHQGTIPIPESPCLP